jgi:hypothetical protein
MLKNSIDILYRMMHSTYAELFQRRTPMRLADQIRNYARDQYVEPARVRHERRFSIRSGDVVRNMKLIGGRVPAVCSALKTREFLEANALRLISHTGPESGQSTTVIYTYEFIDGANSAVAGSPNGSGGTPQSRQAAWEKLRGALKDVFAEYGGGEAYLRAERVSFRDADERK